MTRVEAAARLGVHETMVTAVDEHPAGHLVTLRSGAVMLVSPTVSRAYVPEVDDVSGTELVVGESGPEMVTLPEGAVVAAATPKKSAPRKKAAS